MTSCGDPLENPGPELSKGAISDSSAEAGATSNADEDIAMPPFESASSWPFQRPTALTPVQQSDGPNQSSSSAANNSKENTDLLSASPTHLPKPEAAASPLILRTQGQPPIPGVSPAVPSSTASLPPIQITAPSDMSAAPALIGLPIPAQGSADTAGAFHNPEFVLLDGVKYCRQDQQTIDPDAYKRPESSMNSQPRFHRLVSELAEAFTGLPTAGGGRVDIVAGTDEPEELLARVLETWNRSKPTEPSGASTPKMGEEDEIEAEGDTSTKIKVTLLFDYLRANSLDAPLGGRKILHIAQSKLERILGPETTKAKLPEIRNGSVTLHDVLPTTFNTIRKWLAGKAILHTLPDAVRNDPLRELVYVYVQAARWGHRSIVHDAVNNMPLACSPFEFLETCAIVYTEGCAGVAFRNFFKKGLPVVLGSSKFNHTDRVAGILKQSSELATDFAETMLGLVSQQKYGSRPSEACRRPFPAYTARDSKPSWYQPHGASFCACGLHECTCTSDTASVARPSDTHTIPRRSGYVETAPPSEIDEMCSAPAEWAQHDGGAGWDYSHRPVPTGSIIPGPPMSIADADDRPVRPRNWSSAHLGQGSEWVDAVPASEFGSDPWGYTVPLETPHPTRGRYHDDAGSVMTGPHVQFRTSSQDLVPLAHTARADASLEARLREVEKKLSEAQLATYPIRQSNGTSLARESGDQAALVPSSAASRSTAPRGKPLATSNMPPAPLLHPGVPPAGMPNYLPGYGYNRYVQVGNGVVHPTGPGAYGLAGRTVIATRNSNVWDCTLVFHAGDIIECVVPVEEGRSTTQHNPMNFSGQRLQGICRTQAGSFPASYVREISRMAAAVGPPSAASTAIPPGPPMPGFSSATDPMRSTSQKVRSQAKTNASGVRTGPESAKDKVAQNIDSTWLRSSKTSRESSRADPSRGRRSSTPTTAFRPDDHPPGCPSMRDWRRPCTCYESPSDGTGENNHAWKPTSSWTKDGWDAPDNPLDGTWEAGGH